MFRLPARQSRAEPPPFMRISVFSAGSNPAIDRPSTHRKLKAALKMIDSGHYRRVGYFDNWAIQEVRLILAKKDNPFRFGPSASFNDWSPKESGGFLVMQLRTSRALTA